MPANPVPGDIVPFLRYTDPRAAISWLGAAFGFTPIMIIDGEGGSIAHAELRLGTGAIMLGSVKDDPIGVRPPNEVGVATQGIYIVVPDADALWESAVKAGAEVVRKLDDTPYGAREFAVRDPEGHLWSIGTYRAGSYEG